MRFIFLFLVVLLSLHTVADDNISPSDFSKFRGTWELTKDSLARRNHLSKGCNPNSNPKRKIFRVKIDLKRDSHFYVEGDLTVILEQLLNAKAELWGRAFVRAPFTFSTKGESFKTIGNYKYSYNAILENGNHIFYDTYVKESLKVKKIRGRYFLIYEYDYSPNDGISTLCIFKKVYL